MLATARALAGMIKMKSDTKPTVVFFTDDRIEFSLYGEGDTQAVADKIVPQVQALLDQGLGFAREFLRKPGECTLESVSIFECNEMGEECVLHCTYEPDHTDALPGDLSIDFAFVCGGARLTNWQSPPKCVRFSVRVS